MPLLQANFAFNDLDGNSGPGPEGLSAVIDADNRLVHRGPHKEVGGLVVGLQKEGDGTRVTTCSSLADAR